jgi:hypothetical protein
LCFRKEFDPTGVEYVAMESAISFRFDLQEGDGVVVSMTPPESESICKLVFIVFDIFP